MNHVFMSIYIIGDLHLSKDPAIDKPMDIFGRDWENYVEKLKEKYTIVMVTHNMQQATRISDNTAFFLTGEIVEFDKTENLFSFPKDQRTEDYITGRFG